MTKSEKLFERAVKRIPGGVNSPVRAYGAIGEAPRFIEHADGCYIYDVDGNRYIDYIDSWGPMILGHNFPAIRESVLKACEKGLSFGCATEIEVEMAEFICDRIPHVDMIRMVNSGTEAVMSAIRVARGYTGKNKIIKFAGCYHGHSDAMLVSAGSGVMTSGVPDSAGVPKGCTEDTMLAVYNDLGSVETLFQQAEGQAGRDGLRGRERGPDAVHPEEGAQHQRAGHDGHDAAGKRHRRSLCGAVHRAQIAGGHDIEAREEIAEEVDAHPAEGILRHEGRVLTVEDRDDRPGEPEQNCIQCRRQRKRCSAAQQQELAGTGGIVFAVAPADQRLCALGHTVEDSRRHQRVVRHDAVSRHGHIARQTQEQQVEDGGGHAGGHLSHEARDAQLAALGQQLRRGQLPHKADGAALFEEVAAADRNAQHRRDCRRQRRAGQAEAHGEHEDVIEHHVEEAAAEGRHHGQ